MVLAKSARVPFPPTLLSNMCPAVVFVEKKAAGLHASMA